MDGAGPGTEVGPEARGRLMTLATALQTVSSSSAAVRWQAGRLGLCAAAGRVALARHRRRADRAHGQGLHWGGGVVVGMGLALCVSAFVSPPHHVGQWGSGAEGEQRPQRALRPLVRSLSTTRRGGGRRRGRVLGRASPPALRLGATADHRLSAVARSCQSTASSSRCGRRTGTHRLLSKVG